MGRSTRPSIPKARPACQGVKAPFLHFQHISNNWHIPLPCREPVFRPARTGIIRPFGPALRPCPPFDSTVCDFSCFLRSGRSEMRQNHARWNRNAERKKTPDENSLRVPCALCVRDPLRLASLASSPSGGARLRALRGLRVRVQGGQGAGGSGARAASFTRARTSRAVPTPKRSATASRSASVMPAVLPFTARACASVHAPHGPSEKCVSVMS